MSLLATGTSNLITAGDLKQHYSLRAVKPDNPKLHGFPDNVELNMHEQYEVLHFINAFARKHSFKNKNSGLKVERMLHAKSSSLRSLEKVEAWIVKTIKLRTTGLM